jgi:hypothetical protein
MSQEVNMKLNIDSKNAQKNIDAVNDKLEQTSQQSKDLTTDVSEMGNQLDAVTGGAVSGFNGLLGTLKNVTKGFRTLKGVLLTSGIGAIALAIGAVAQAFKDSEEGQNKFAKIMGVIGSVVGNLTDKLSDLGMMVLENPLGLLEEVGKNIMNRLKGIIMLVPSLGKALGQLLSGEFKAAGQTASDAFLLVATGVEDATEKIKEFGKEVVEDGKKATEVADLRAKADKAERALIVGRAKADRDRAALLEKSVDKENFTVQQRIEFLKQAAAVEENITKQEIEAARLRAEAKTLENTLSKSTKEDMIEEEELKARLIQLETARLVKQKEVTGQIIAFTAEEAAAKKAIADKEAAEKKAREDKLAAEEKERKDKLAKEEEERQKLKEESDERIAAEEQRQIQEVNAAKHAAADQAIALFGAETKAGKAALVAKQVMNAMELIESAKKTITLSSLKVAESNAAVAQGTAETAKIGFPQNIPMLIAYGLQAAGIVMSMKQAFGAARNAAASAGGGGGVSAPPSRTPAFNIVGSSPTNQIAEALNGQNQRPIKAFVTSSDVSSAQSLDRNIIETAKIG